jgi:cysteine desulfurase
MGLRPERVAGSVRFSLGRGTTPEEIDRVLEVLPPIVERMRRIAASLSPAAEALA